MNDMCGIQPEIVEQIDQLPPMPHSVTEVMQLGGAEDCSPIDLANVVCKDPALAGRVLEFSNSSYFGLSREVTSVQRAVLLLGFEMVKNLVLSTFVHSTLQDGADGYAQTSASLWQHSFGAATASMVLAVDVAPDLVDVAYTAGLMHDIGKVALATFVEERFQEVISSVEKRKQSFREAEREVLGTTHAEVGAIVAERWNLSPGLQDVIRHHHDPQDAEEEPELAALVNLADGICSILGVGAGLDATDCTLSEWSLQTLGLDQQTVEPVMGKVMERLLTLESMVA